MIRGNHIGSKIGFPTANIELSSTKISPMNGVYFTRTSVGRSTFNSVSNVGNKPTIGDYNKSIETHIFGVNEELYGREIKIEFLKLHSCLLYTSKVRTGSFEFILISRLTVIQST